MKSLLEYILEHQIIEKLEPIYFLKEIEILFPKKNLDLK